MEEHNGDEEEDLGGEEEVVCFSSFSLFLSSSLSFPFSFPFFFTSSFSLVFPAIYASSGMGWKGTKPVAPLMLMFGTHTVAPVSSIVFRPAIFL